MLPESIIALLEYGAVHWFFDFVTFCRKHKIGVTDTAVSFICFAYGIK